MNHPSPEVCNVAVDILTADDNYVASALWSKKDIHVESEEELLSTGVPKAVMLYQSKVLERLAKVQQQRLQSGLSEEEEAEAVRILNKLNSAKLALSKRSKRLIL